MPKNIILSSVVDPHHFDADQDADPDSTYFFNVDPDTDPDLYLIWI
jgi:hypothetical protein